MNSHTAASSASYVTIASATAPAEWADVRTLLGEFIGTFGDEYAVGGGGLIEEIPHVEQTYTREDECMLIAYVGGEPAGCLALKHFAEGVGEVRRMYVRESARGRGIGRMLLEEIVARARKFGYKKLHLDSLHRFQAAHRIYHAAGFSACPPYDPHTTEAMKTHMLFMGKEL